MAPTDQKKWRTPSCFTHVMVYCNYILPLRQSAACFCSYFCFFVLMCFAPPTESQETICLLIDSFHNIGLCGCGDICVRGQPLWTSGQFYCFMLHYGCLDVHKEDSVKSLHPDKCRGAYCVLFSVWNHCESGAVMNAASVLMAVTSLAPRGWLGEAADPWPVLKNRLCSICTTIKIFSPRLIFGNHGNEQTHLAKTLDSPLIGQHDYGISFFLWNEKKCISRFTQRRCGIAIRSEQNIYWIGCSQSRWKELLISVVQI